MATPAPLPGAGGEVEDSQLMFMSHAPGVSLPPRMKVEESFAGKILGTFAKTIGGGKEGEAQGSAGVGALERALKASKRSAQRKERSVDETLDGASKHVGGQPDAAVVVGQAAAATDPSFFSLLSGAFSTPVRGPLITILHVLLVALALLLLELTPPLGLVACALAAIELCGLRTRLVQDACAGRKQIRWPEASELVGSLLIAGCASLWCLLPGVGAGLAAVRGPAFEADGASSLVARGRRLARPAPVGLEPSPERGFGHMTLLELEALAAPELGDPLRSSETLARDLQVGVKASVTQLVRIDQATPLGIVARVLLLLGFLAYPMTILAAVRLRSVYAALFPPIVIRSALTVPGVYLLTVVATLAFALGAAGGAVHGLPLLRALLGGALGHAVWIVLEATYLVAGHMILAGLLGRVYLSRRMALGWD